MNLKHVMLTERQSCEKISGTKVRSDISKSDDVIVVLYMLLFIYRLV